MASKTDRLCDELDANGFPADGALDVLTDSRCRTVLERLAREDGPTELCELRAGLTPEAGGSNDRPASGVTASRLHHVVLPKLDDVGLVAYDWRANVVDLDASSRRVSEYLDRTAPSDRQ
jgi:hypothetical protein